MLYYNIAFFDNQILIMNGSLYLIPTENTIRSEEQLKALTSMLQENHFIGQEFRDEKFSYFCGERFLQSITFMGCSPHLEFSPRNSQDRQFCFISVEQTPTISLRTGKLTTAPRCPTCRHRFSDWENTLGHTPDHRIDCPKCHTTVSPCMLDWRHSAGCSNLFIHIHQIFPGEAVPVNGLLQQLETFSKCRWTYFYLAE